MTIPHNLPIYRLHNGGLGDHWASINLLHMLGLQRGEMVYFSSRGEHRQRHAEILGVLGIGNVLPVDDEGDTPLDGFDVWATHYAPTLPLWSRHSQTQAPTLCYQFDGESAAADKNPGKSERDQILVWAATRGLTAIPLGRDNSIPEIVYRLANCTLFVGCDSGVSHIAHSVGCPTYLLEYNLPVVTYHRHKNYVLCKGAGHFTQQADNYLHYLRFIGGA